MELKSVPLEYEVCCCIDRPFKYFRTSKESRAPWRETRSMSIPLTLSARSCGEAAMARDVNGADNFRSIFKSL
jgi:hypothetical protein